MWKIKKLEDLTGTELLEILRLRVDTFVVEQSRIYHEVDNKDKIALHVFYQNKDTNMVESYARIYRADNQVIFGRVATKRDLRGTGQGNALMCQILGACNQYFPNMPIEIEAQVHVVPFYEKFGFEVIGEPFIFESTPHIRMKWTNANESDCAFTT